MKTTETTPEPRLAPPGAGLPWPELQIARLRFRWARRSGDGPHFDAVFRREREAIADGIRSCSAEEAAERVLIKRIRGLEDSSRHWSVWMVLDHLRITNEAFANIMTALHNGIVPPRPATTAAVKPDPEVGGEVVAAYERSCDAVLAASAVTGEGRTSANFAHPWFGPLDAGGWHALSGFHMGLHRKQIERILAGLRGR
ncbi:MAG: DinB family protein [Verrucomicrobiales bacterium]|nr:DinB family protein [Verrucomicrobiales bacterium]